jgi:hypothetical protein
LCSEIHFNDGAIVAASGGSAMGITALNRILGSTGGTFEFHESDSHFRVTINSPSNTSLILDMLTNKDDETEVSFP